MSRVDEAGSRPGRSRTVENRYVPLDWLRGDALLGMSVVQFGPAEWIWRSPRHVTLQNLTLSRAMAAFSHANV